VVLIIDEAQGLSAEVLEQVRLLTNLETQRQKLLQIILVGQPELRDMLARTELRQLAQRITGRYHLMPLSAAESRAYVNHRLTVAGAMAPIFTAAGLRSVQRVTQGIPRLINIICDRALLGAYTRELRQVDAGLVRRAAHEVLGEVPASHRPAKPWLALAAALLLAAALALGIRNLWPQPPAPTIAAAAPATQQASLQDWLTDATHPTDTDTALHTLFSLWNTQYTPAGSGSGCREAEQAALRCLYRRGTWNNLRSYDLPAVITLTDTQGAAHQLVVTGLNDTQVTLRAGDKSMSFTTAQVEPLWYGEYLLLWRPDPNAGTALAPGMTGTGVAWLRTQLAKLQHTEDSGDNSYDDSLATAVKQFQASRHMKVDGIAGDETLLELNTALDPHGAPRLDPGKG
jgi:general secretion pathway protein A